MCPHHPIPSCNCRPGGSDFWTCLSLSCVGWFYLPKYNHTPWRQARIDGGLSRLNNTHPIDQARSSTRRAYQIISFLSTWIECSKQCYHNQYEQIIRTCYCSTRGNFSSQCLIIYHEDWELRRSKVSFNISKNFRKLQVIFQNPESPPDSSDFPAKINVVGKIWSM